MIFKWAFMVPAINIQFPIDKIKEDRDLGNLPAAGKPTFKLKLYNAPHYQATPRNFVLQVSAVSASWQEGAGLDMEGYSDVVASGSHGSNWVTALTPSLPAPTVAP